MSPENFAAFSGAILHILEAVSVMPLLETPGRRAIACISPMANAFLKVGLSSPLGRYFVIANTAAVNIKSAPTIFAFSKSASTFSSNKT